MDWLASLSLGGASGFAAYALVPAVDFAMAPAFAAVAAVLALTLIGLTAMRRFGDHASELAGFVPVEFPEADDALELDDAIAPIEQDSRVVRLFAPETIAAPGELAQRIDQWLDGARERTQALAASGQAIGAGGHGRTSSVASAALHSALDELRRSLR